MEFQHEFTVPVPASEAWRVLLDVQRIAPCLPGATIESVDGDEITGRIKVKVGPVSLSYKGTARFIEKDDAARRFVLQGSGRETRGSGTAKATITARMQEEGSSTRVTVATDLAVTGKPAQFGRGVMADVAEKLVGQFATCLADLVRAPAAPREEPAESKAGETAAAQAAGGAAAGAVEAPRPAAEAIDLFGTAGLPVLKRLAPVAAGLAILLIGWLLTRRRPPVVVIVLDSEHSAARANSPGRRGSWPWCR